MEEKAANQPLARPGAGTPAPTLADDQAVSGDAELLRAVRLAVFDRLATYLTHELNQPLSIVRMTAENLLLDLDEEEARMDGLREQLTTVRDQTERMTRLIERLGQLGHQNDDKSRRFDVGKVLDDTAATLRHAAVMSGLSFELSPPDDETMVRGCARHLWLVLVGLLTMTWEPGRARHAGKTNARGSGILIHGERRKSTVAVDLIHDGCEATGQPGYSVSELARDVRLRAARRVVEQLGGRFDAKLHENGLHVRIVLPLADATDEGERTREAKPLAAARSRSLDILLVDDEELALEGILEHLSRQGHRVVTARNGRDALSSFGARPFDVVLTDLRMPVMDGNALIRELRRLSGLPIIVMTGQAGPEDEERALSEGASTILHKPVRLRDLSSALDRVTAGL